MSHFTVSGVKQAALPVEKTFRESLQNPKMSPRVGCELQEDGQVSTNVTTYNEWRSVASHPSIFYVNNCTEHFIGHQRKNRFSSALSV